MIVKPRDFKISLDLTYLRLGLVKRNKVRSNTLMQTTVLFLEGQQQHETEIFRNGKED